MRNQSGVSGSRENRARRRVEKSLSRLATLRSFSHFDLYSISKCCCINQCRILKVHLLTASINTDYGIIEVSIISQQLQQATIKNEQSTRRCRALRGTNLIWVVHLLHCSGEMPPALVVF